jgi:hypothetical protein
MSDVGSATEKLSNAAMESFYTKSLSLLGSPDKVISAMQGQRQIGLKEREVATKEALVPSEIAKNQGVAGYYNSGGRGSKDTLKARAQEYADILVESGEINPATKKPYTEAEAKKHALGLVLKSPDTKGITANPDGSVTQNGVLYVPDPKNPGNFIPAKGLPNSPQNSVVAAFANFDPNAKKKPVASPRAIEIESNP